MGVSSFLEVRTLPIRAQLLGAQPRRRGLDECLQGGGLSLTATPTPAPTVSSGVPLTLASASTLGALGVGV